MGYTQFEIKLIEKYLPEIKSVLDIGSQNDYTTSQENPPFISEWYKSKGIEYTSIDLAGDNGSLKLNLAYPIDLGKKFDAVVDCGTGEHIVQAEDYPITQFHDGYINSVYAKNPICIDEGFYDFWLNKNNLLKEDGLSISVNPLTGMWPQHGYTYLGEDFYKELANVSGYELLETGLNGATGNWTTGTNVYGVLRKTNNVFPDFETFKQLPIFKQ